MNFCQLLFPSFVMIFQYSFMLSGDLYYNVNSE